MNLLEVKKEIVEFGKKMITSGLVRGTWGNISVRCDGVICITPSGMDYLTLNAEDISVVDLKSGREISGASPSSELEMHKAIYAHGRIKAVIHTHSRYLSSMSALHRGVPPLTEDQVMIIGGDIPCADYQPCGTDMLAGSVGGLFDERNGVIMANHGYVGGGRDLTEAFANCMIAEKSAAVYLDCLASGLDICVIPDSECETLSEKYTRYRK